VGLGFAYSLYVIGKNTLIGREIATSKLGSSSIGAFTTIVFIVSLIAGTIVGSKIGETSGWIPFGILAFLALLILAAGVLSTADTRRERTEFVFSFDRYVKLFARYGIFMVGLGCFWQISVEASQVAINYSKEYFGKTNSESALLLLFSSVGAILGNVLSVRLSKNRLPSFMWMTGVFIGIIFLFSTILGLAESMKAYVIVQMLAFSVGFFFGGAVNLSESHFYALLGGDAEKDHVSALYGFVLSLVGAVTMFASEKILHTGSYVGISVFLGLLAAMALYGGHRGLRMTGS
jgi:MFS family permease